MGATHNIALSLDGNCVIPVDSEKKNNKSAIYQREDRKLTFLVSSGLARA